MNDKLPSPDPEIEKLRELAKSRGVDLITEDDIPPEDADLRAIPDDKRRRFVNGIPTQKAAILYAERFMRMLPKELREPMAKEWWNFWNGAMWCNDNSWPIQNWAWKMSINANYYRIDCKRRDPDRIPDARKRNDSGMLIDPRSMKHAANYRATRKEDIQNVLG